jgi:hypothetical protein
MAGDIGSGQCRDDDQAPAVGEGAPLVDRIDGGMSRFLLKIAQQVFSVAYAALACSSRLEPSGAIT